MDDGEFLTESLAEVASQQEESAQTDDQTQADFVREGSKAVIRMRRVRVKSSMPATTEQLRHKFRLLAVHWGMLCQRYPNKHWAAGYEQTMLRNHVDWLLGDQVAELRAMTPSGEESISPSWPVVLRYELEVHKEAMRQLNMCGVTLATAFAAGRKSDELRTRYPITPLALGGHTDDYRTVGQRRNDHRKGLTSLFNRRRRSRSPNGKEPSNVPQRDKLKPARSGQKACYNKACKKCPDAFHQMHNGKSICFSFQGLKGCSRGRSCKHQHICAHCFGAHPYDMCPINVESRAAYLKQRLHSVRFARRSHNSAISSQKEGTVGVPTVPAVLFPTSASVQAQSFPLVQGEEIGVGIPTPTIAVSPSVLSPSVLSGAGSVRIPTLPAVNVAVSRSGNNHTQNSPSLPISPISRSLDFESFSLDFQPKSENCSPDELAVLQLRALQLTPHEKCTGSLVGRDAHKSAQCKAKRAQLKVLSVFAGPEHAPKGQEGAALLSDLLLVQVKEVDVSRQTQDKDSAREGTAVERATPKVRHCLCVSPGQRDGQAFVRKQTGTISAQRENVSVRIPLVVTASEKS